MTKKTNAKTQLTVTVQGGKLHLRLHIPVQTLLALIAILTGSPALVAVLTRLAAN